MERSAVNDFGFHTVSEAVMVPSPGDSEPAIRDTAVVERGRMLVAALSGRRRGRRAVSG